MPSSSAQDKAYEFLIRNALVIDGRSRHPYQADVALSGDVIVDIGELDETKAREVIAAKGLILTPGFIDVHTHSDFNPLIYPHLANKLFQGVTTEVTGNCGMSAAPVKGQHVDKITTVWAREGVMLPMPLSWGSFAAYRHRLQAAGLATNHAGLIGHGNLRSAVMGFEKRRASPAEIEAMKTLLNEALQEGAYGISFGLIYLPGLYAHEEEIVALCKEAAVEGGVCAFHMRSEGAHLGEAVAEVIHIAEQTGARVQISHLKAAGASNWAKIDDAFRQIEEARRRGLPIMADAYPYTASYAELGVILPNDLYEREDRLDLFRDPTQRGLILARLEDYFSRKKMDWTRVRLGITEQPAFRKFAGMTLETASRYSGRSPVEFLYEVLHQTHFEVSAFYFSQSHRVVENVLAKPYVLVGSDSIADGSAFPHPRCYGTFPKIIDDYVNDLKLLSLPQAVRRMTSEPARHFGIKDRGEIRPGAFADLVLFDPNLIADHATYENPPALSEGIQWVFVNGRPAIRHGQWTHVKNGRYLLRNRLS